MTIPNPVFIFRMVHWKNIEYILRHGLCRKSHPEADPEYIKIGHQQLIKDREDTPIPISGYGTLGDYIPFYFWGHSPMLYMIMNGLQGVQQYPQEEIVYIVIDSARIIEEGLTYIFTDRHAKVKLAQFTINPEDLHNLRWDVIKSREWKDTEEDFQRRDFKQAEFLIKDHIPVEFIHTIIAKTESKKLEIEQIVRNLDLNILVTIAREGKLYY